MTCKNCKYWLQHKAELGYCRRYPPTFRVYTDSISQWTESDAEYPETLDASWCGEFKDKTQPEVKRGRPPKK